MGAPDRTFGGELWVRLMRLTVEWMVRQEAIPIDAAIRRTDGHGIHTTVGIPHSLFYRGVGTQIEMQEGYVATLGELIGAAPVPPKSQKEGHTDG